MGAALFSRWKGGHIWKFLKAGVRGQDRGNPSVGRKFRSYAAKPTIFFSSGSAMLSLKISASE